MGVSMINKKRIKSLVAFALLLSILLLTSCPEYDVAYAPDNFPNTLWTTQDGKITFTVKEKMIERFNGKTIASSGQYVDVQPLYTRMFGEVCTENSAYSFFIYSAPAAYFMSFISEELPLDAGDEDRSKVLERYTLLSCAISYKNNEHFIATVETSKIDEIPVGTVLDFYRTEAK